MPRGLIFAINDQLVSCPVEDTLSPIVIGEGIYDGDSFTVPTQYYPTS